MKKLVINFVSSFHIEEDIIIKRLYSKGYNYDTITKEVINSEALSFVEKQMKTFEVNEIIDNGIFELQEESN